MSLQRRVVVTGLGTLNPLGNSLRESWARALEGKSGIAQITAFDLTDCPVTIAGEVKGFDTTKITPETFSPAPGVEITQQVLAKESKKVGRFANFAIAASIEAYFDSGLNTYRDKVKAERMGVNIGVGMGGLPEMGDVHKAFFNKGYRRVTPFFIPQCIPNMASGMVSIYLNLRGPNQCNVTACASSAHSIGESFHQIQRGEADVMFAGGSEAVICEMGIAGFASMRALSTRNDAPEKASRPYDKDRDGFVMGEGAAVLVLEEYEHAKKRGAKIYAEVLGYGATSDAFHMTLPAAEGEGGYRAMEIALQESKLSKESIGYVNAHGTSTPAGDPEESSAIARLFPNAKNHLHVSSTKSMTGHLLGAAGALEALMSVMAVKEGKIPPTINLDNIDPKCAETGLNFTPNKMVEKKLKAALSNSFGFGGTNACLIFGAV